MKAIVVGESGPEIKDAPKPEPGRHEILVRVRAFGLNRADLLMSMGRMHGALGGPGTILGMEWSGEVAAVGPEVRDFKPGDRVMCTGKSGWADYALADARRTSPVPGNNTSFEQAASLPVGLQTMHDAVVSNGRLQPGESVLVQGASSGVGLMAMQIAKLMGASLVIGTSTNPERRARLGEFGADLALDSTAPDWVDAVLAATGGKGVNLIIDQIAAPVAIQNMKAAAICGRIVNVGRLGGWKGEFDYDLHALKRIDFIGVTFRTRSAEEIETIVRKARADLWQHVESGKLRLPLDRVYPLAEFREALEHMKHNRHFGKVVVTMP